jgi:hypothetical protein
LFRRACSSFQPHEQNFISASALRDIATLRQDLFFSLAEAGFVDSSAGISNPVLNTYGDNTNLVKSVVLGGLWPQVAEVRLPKSAIKFDQVAAGTVQRENSAVEFRIYDLNRERVFIHPGSVLFSEVAWKPPFVCYFTKHATKKTYLRDCTQVRVCCTFCSHANQQKCGRSHLTVSCFSVAPSL